MSEFVNEQVKHVSVGTKGETPLCSLTLQHLTLDLIVRGETEATCERCKATLYAFRRLCEVMKKK